MPAVSIAPADLAPFATIDDAKAQAMIDDALALAALAAPCIDNADFAYDAAAKAIIRRAIIRWNDTGSGALTQQGAGPFQVSVDNRQPHRNLLWPSEIAQLQELCRDGGPSTQAFSIDTTPTTARSSAT